jgi:hypothetical protein
MVHLIQTDKTPSSKESARLSTAFQEHPARRILVVDDDQNTRQLSVDGLAGSKLEPLGDPASKIPITEKSL